MIHLCFCGHQKMFQTAVLKTVIQGQDRAYKIVSFPETICLPLYTQRDLPIEVAYHQVIVPVPCTLVHLLLRHLCAYKQSNLSVSTKILIRQNHRIYR